MREPLAAGVSDQRERRGQGPLQLKEAKIAALGVRVQKWVTSHGIAINLDPDLAHYAGIVPCGIREFGVTSMRRMGSAATMEELDAAVKASFERVFSSSLSRLDTI